MVGAYVVVAGLDPAIHVFVLGARGIDAWQKHMLGPGECRTRSAGMPKGHLAPSKLHLRRSLHLSALLPKIEELLRTEAERAGEQYCRELLDSGIVFLHRIVEEAPRRRDLVLHVGKLRLQLLEIGVSFEVGVALRKRKQLPQRA